MRAVFSRCARWICWPCCSVAACCVAARRRPSVPATYTVKRGDTLYAIAWRHRLDWQDLARWNGIGRDYVIHPGQVLKLYPSRGVARVRASARPARSARQTAPARVADCRPPVQWQWPVCGGTATLTSRPNGGQGLTISGRLGEEIRAAAAGRVVYTGTGSARLRPAGHHQAQRNLSQRVRPHAVGRGSRGRRRRGRPAHRDDGRGPQGDADAVLRDPHQRHARQSAVVAAASA